MILTSLNRMFTDYCHNEKLSANFVIIFGFCKISN